MKAPRITTILIIICILIIGLYAMGEVNYFSTKIAVEQNLDAPVILIPSIGVQEKINNESLSLGVLHDPDSYNPTVGDVLLFGHRTLQGSPFLKLNELNNGDELILEWPGIGEVKYKVIDKTVVPAGTELDAAEGGNNLYLITCDPIGSTENRLIIKGEMTSTGQINDEILTQNPQAAYAFYITVGFLIVGLVFSFIVPQDNRIYVIAVVLIVTAILAICCFVPMPSEWIYDKINFLNGGSSWV